MSVTRKVQQTPTGTFFVCLPRNWANQNQLEKGSEISLEETSDGKLLVYTKAEAEPQLKEATLNVGPYLSREIIGRYLLGYDVIKVEAKNRIDAGMRNIIKSTANSLAGLMIVEETTSSMTLQCLMQQPFTSSMTLQCLMQQPFTSPEKILTRNQASTVRMIRDAASSFVTSDMDLAKNVIERDVENNKFYFLLVRILRTILQNPRLSEKLAIVPIECLDYRLAAGFIEGIGDACVEMASSTLELDGVKLSEELRKLMLELQSTCVEANEQAFKSFLGKDIEAAENVRSIRVKIDDNCARIADAAKDSSLDLMPQVLAAVSFLRQIYERSVDMADLVV